MLNNRRLSLDLLRASLPSALLLRQLHHDPVLKVHNKLLMLQACCAASTLDYDASVAAEKCPFSISFQPVSCHPSLSLLGSRQVTPF